MEEYRFVGYRIVPASSDKESIGWCHNLISFQLSNGYESKQAFRQRASGMWRTKIARWFLTMAVRSLVILSKHRKTDCRKSGLEEAYFTIERVCGSDRSSHLQAGTSRSIYELREFFNGV
jgi:hypothetical protein